MIFIAVPFIVGIFYFLVSFVLEVVTLIILLITKKQKQHSEFQKVGVSYVMPGSVTPHVGGLRSQSTRPQSQEKMLEGVASNNTIKRSEHIVIIFDKLTILSALSLVCYILLTRDNFELIILVEIILIVILIILIRFLLRFLLSNGMINKKSIFYNLSFAKRIVGIIICGALIALIIITYVLWIY